MSKPTALPLRIGTAVLAEDLSTTPNRPRQRELTWIRRPEPTPVSDEDTTVDTENR